MLQREERITTKKDDVKEKKKISNIKILMYHRVFLEKPEKYDHWHYVTVAEFKKQIKLIDKMGFTPITFTDYQLYLEDKLTLPAKPIILTFDDGYLDTFENAIPVLSEMGMKAVIFVMGNRSLGRAFWDEKGEGDVCPLMSDEQIRIANDMEFEIGSHSLNHDKLSTLPEHEAVYSINKSKKEIEEILDEPIKTFAYPYGIHNKKIEEIVANSGFSFACGVYTGSPKFGETTFDFRRIAINQHTGTVSFLVKLLTPFQYAEWIYHLIKTRNKGEKVAPEVTEESIRKRRNGFDSAAAQKSETISKTDIG